MKMTLTLEKTLMILPALNMLVQAHSDVVKGPDGKDVIVPSYYHFDGPTAMRIKMDLKALNGLTQTFEETRVELIKRLAAGGDELTQKDNPVEFAQYLDEIKKLMTEEHELDLYKLDEEKLLAKNDSAALIPVLMNLAPILNEAVITD